MLHALRRPGGLRCGQFDRFGFRGRWRRLDNFLIIIGWPSKLHHLRFNAQATPELFHRYCRPSARPDGRWRERRFPLHFLCLRLDLTGKTWLFPFPIRSRHRGNLTLNRCGLGPGLGPPLPPGFGAQEGGEQPPDGYNPEDRVIKQWGYSLVGGLDPLPASLLPGPAMDSRIPVSAWIFFMP